MFLSVQTKRACNTTALRRNSVDMSPSISAEVIEMVIKFLILSHSVRHIDTLCCILVVGQRRIWCLRRTCGQRMKSHGAS